MPSPAKKRKLNNGSKTAAAPTRNLEYFFNKQKQDASSTATPELEEPKVPDSELTDEELARKLQDEWNQEVAADVPPGTASANQTGEDKTDREDSTAPTADQTTTDESAVGRVNGDAPQLGPEISVNGGKKTLTLQSAGATEDSLTSSIPFDQSPLTFEPSKYVVELKEAWKADGGDATYALLTRCFVLVSSTQSRIKIVDTLVNCLRVLIEADPSSLLPAVRPFYPFPACSS